jgi:nucleotide-binding universal stress UspA family protein
MKRIVVGYDETDASQRALERAAELGRAFGARLVVASVAHRSVANAPRAGGAVDPSDTPADRVEELRQAERYLAEQDLDAEFVPALGDPADTIVAVAEEHDADLIVVGTREPNIIERLLGQSVSQSVAHKSHRDVLIVH